MQVKKPVQEASTLQLRHHFQPLKYDIILLYMYMFAVLVHFHIYHDMHICDSTIYSTIVSLISGQSGHETEEADPSELAAAGLRPTWSQPCS